jgi:hypothetical protein
LNGYRLTMHLWPPPFTDDEVDDEQIHDHRFNFWSSVLLGTLESQNFIRARCGAPIREYQYVPEKRSVATVGNFYKFTGVATLLDLPGSCVGIGEAYHLRYHSIHRVVLPRQKMTCTLVLRGPRLRQYSSVFSNSRRYDPARQNIMFTPGQLAVKLRLVLRALEQRQSSRRGCANPRYST